MVAQNQVEIDLISHNSTCDIGNFLVSNVARNIAGYNVFTQKHIGCINRSHTFKIQDIGHIKQIMIFLKLKIFQPVLAISLTQAYQGIWSVGILLFTMCFYKNCIGSIKHITFFSKCSICQFVWVISLSLVYQGILLATMFKKKKVYRVFFKIHPISIHISIGIFDFLVSSISRNIAGRNV